MWFSGIQENVDYKKCEKCKESRLLKFSPVQMHTFLLSSSHAVKPYERKSVNNLKFQLVVFTAHWI